MIGKNGKVMRILGVMLAGIIPWTMAGAQGGGADSLEGQLAAKYKMVKLGTDSTGVVVIEPGTVLVLKKGGIVSVPSKDMVILPTYVKDGEVHGASGTATEGAKKLLNWKLNVQKDTKLLPSGEKVYVSKIEINRKDSKVALTLIECDSCNGVTDPSSRKAQVVFQFPKGYLDGADGGQISDVINQTLATEAADSGEQQQGQEAQGQQEQQQAAPAPAPAQPPPTIQLGQSPDEVTGALGQPQKIVNLGTKQIYYYKDMKITFVKGKVSDVQ